MNLGNLMVQIEQGLSLGQLIFGGVNAIIGAVRAGRAKVTTPDGHVLTAEEVLEAVAKAQSATLAVGDAAAGRIEERHGG